MPNNCNNRLIVNGPEDRVAEFIQSAEGPIYNGDSTPDISPLSFNQIIPLPDDALELPYDPFGHDAEIELWGVRLGAQEAEIADQDDGFCVYEFWTPCVPPMEFLRKASVLYPEIEFDLRYRENNCDIFGRIVVQNGITIGHIDWDEEGPNETKRRESAKQRIGAFVMNLLPQSPLCSFKSDQAGLQSTCDQINARFRSAVDAVEKLRANGWTCSLHDNYELVCTHSDSQTRAEMEKRLEQLDVNWRIAI